jgi:hypothetical protein
MPIPIKDLLGKHAGRMAFVLGAGPSLRHVDPAWLKNNVVIAVNSSISKFQEADYFLGDDVGLKNWAYYTDLLPKLSCTSFLYHGKLKDHVEHLDLNKICWITHKTWYHPQSNKYFEDGLVFTKEGPIIGARTALGSAVHVAHQLGCDPIVLLGADACYEDGKRYFWQFKGEIPCKRITKEPVFCFPNAGTRDGHAIDSHCRDFLQYWDAVAIQTKKQDIDIINCSGGILNSFPRAKLEDVLEKFGKNTKKK